MSEQRTLGSMAYDTKGKVTRRERFLREMDAVIPCAALPALIAPHCGAPTEHVLRVVKCQWDFTKVRYRGLMKNTTRVLVTVALANLYLVRHRLLPQGT